MKFLVDSRHTYSSKPIYKLCSSIDEAAEVAHKFFLRYDFEIKDGKPFDAGNDDGLGSGFDCFENVKIHNGKILEFMHCDGEGPMCEVSELDEQMQHFYQIAVIGPYKSFSGEGKFYSKKIFTSYNEAELYLPEFIKKCTGNRIDDLSEITKYKIVTLELGSEK